MSLRQKFDQLLFIKNNRRDIAALLTLRARIIVADLTALQSKVLSSVVYLGIALVFFLLTVLSLLFGINTIIADPDTKIIVFFSLAGLAFVLFIGFVFFALRRLNRAYQAVGDSVRDFAQELDLVGGEEDPKSVMAELERTFGGKDELHEP